MNFLAPLSCVCLLTSASLALGAPKTRPQTNNAAVRPTPVNNPAKFVWHAMPLVSPGNRRAGISGGEGGQWPRALAISPANPNFLMMGTDVGGIYRSLDGGANWQVCMVGWNARGGNAFALDPKNAKRLIGVGANANDFGPNPNGLYLSSDGGASWKQTLPLSVGNDDRESVAYDPSSFDGKVGFCRVAYFDSQNQGLWKTLDGGLTWAQINKDLSNCIVRVHPTKGYVYLASNQNPGHGFYKSSDGGATWKQINDSYTLGLDVSPAAPDNVYLSRWDKVQISTDVGESFHYIGTSWPTDGLPEGTPIQDLTVSPLDPNLLACWHKGDNFNWQRFYSVDGGKSWKESAFNSVAKDGPARETPGAFLPFNARNGIWAYHPARKNVVFGIGGDWITKSSDSGATFGWSSNGENAVMVGSSFGFSPHAPDVSFLSFQDYNGAFSLDGGQTWNYRDVSGKGWGGFEYGGFALDAKVMWSGDAQSWGGPRRLRLSRDGGATWANQKDSAGRDLIWSGADISFADPTNPQIAFASNFRTTDGGASWTSMDASAGSSGCDGVYTFNSRDPHELFGRRGDHIVRTTDGGARWTSVATIEGGIGDLAFDAKANRFWIASGDALKKWEGGALVVVDTPKDRYGATRISSVAVDPLDPNIVYATNHKDVYACNNALVRSLDGGKTWQNLAVNTPLPGPQAPGGPHEANWVRVHPRTREAWVAGQCFGMWKFAMPASASNSVPKSHPFR